MITQFLKAILKAILFFILLLILYVFFIAWVNIWIRPGSIGILYSYSKPAASSSNDSKNATTDTSKPDSISLVSKQAWNWEWKRAIPFRTRLIQLSLLQQSTDIAVRYFLPSSRLYSNLVEKTEEIFLEEGSFKLSYTLDTEKILAYLQTDSLIYPEDIIRTLESQMQHTIQRDIRNYSEFSQDGLKTIIRSSLQALPVHITSIQYQIHSTADRELYTLLKDVYTQDLENKLNLSVNSRFTEYISVLEKLSDLSKQDGDLLELIRLLPPNEVLQYLEN